MARTLLFVKHRLPVLWTLVDWLNARLFAFRHASRMRGVVDEVCSEFLLPGFEFRSLGASDLLALSLLIERQGEDRLRYFQPHGFDPRTLGRMLSNPAFLMFGVWEKDEICGYFFLRCFWNRRCFVGRLIDKEFERRGIGRVMNQIMYHIAWRAGFRCMTTISRHNRAVMRSHERNPHARLLGELPNDYLLVEFTQDVREGGGIKA
ncbi:MAG: hypothetical protein ABS41_07375 [Arenimonas sp. SCN 70-307]|nr:MAG: hypothetical protein ABS41_07375 [Arenimonas sp. SCN 70-307]